MKKSRNLRRLLALLLGLGPLCASADTFFTDNFAHGSTTNGPSVPGGTPTASYTSYALGSTKDSRTSTIGPGAFLLRLAGNTTAGWAEAAAIFTANPVTLTMTGDYIEMQLTFTNASGTLLGGGSQSLLFMGLYNSAGQAPLTDGVLANAGFNIASTYTTGNCASWQGYNAQVSSNGNTRIYTRPQQTTATASSAQELLAGSGNTGGYSSPAPATLTTFSGTNIAMDTTSPHTMILRITLTSATTLSISNALFVGADTSGTRLVSQQVTDTTNILATGFDALAFGSFNKGTTMNPQITVSEIKITGQSTAVSAPPDIVSQPVSASAPLGTMVPFTVQASGFSMTYQWHRGGTNLANGGNISGATSPTLIINPVTSADYASSYNVTITGAGDYSTNSQTVSLTSRAAGNLTWAGPGADWDLNTSENWTSGGSPAKFNYGDNVTFDGGTPAGVNLSGQYLSAGIVSVSANYAFSGSGSLAGPARLHLTGSYLDIGNANAHTGGTVIDNPAALLYLRNFAALGSGPVTNLQAGAMIEVVPIGSATIGLQGDIYAADDLTIQFDGTGSFAGVIFGALNGAADKILKLTFNPATAPSTNRYRLYGANTVNSANILIDGYATANALYNGSVIAPYHGSGSQTYNGVISGNGGLVQRANGLTILNGQNTYSGGTTPTAGAIGFGADTTGAVDSGPIGTGPLYVAPELPNTTGTGTILASGGDRTIANPIQYPSATNNQTLRIGGTYALTLSGPVTLNGNDSTGTQTNRTFEVTNTALTTISGGISGAGFGLTKTGNGVLALTATESYTGPTAVSAGTLLVNGQLHAQSAVTVATNATLGGTGTINGSVTVSAGGILSPGSSIGTLTLGSLSTAGNLLIEVNKSAGQTSDRLSVSGTLANTGTGILTVTNLGGVAFAQGDTFPIFNKAMTGGGSLTITNFGGTFYWTNNLAVDGTITVGSTIPTIPTTPTDITATVADGSLNLSWPSSYVGWDLQSNSVAVDNAAMWFTVPGSASVSSMQLPISTTGNVFYRLHYLAP